MDRKKLPETTIIEFLSLSSGIKKLINNYEEKYKESEYSAEVNDIDICIGLFKKCMTSKQKKNVKDIENKYSLKRSFMCGTCGFKGELILIYGPGMRSKIVRFEPKSTNVVSLVSEIKNAFSPENIRITILNKKD